MKLSHALNVLQLAAIAVLCFQMFGMHNRLQQLAEQQPAQVTPGIQMSAPLQIQQPSAATPSLQQIQAMLRRELAAALPARQPLDTQTEQYPIDPVAQQLQMDLVDSELDFYIDQGVISDQDMARLQLDIAQLDPDSRKLAMTRLVKALNSQALEGRL